MPLVASLGNGCTFLWIKIILHKTQFFAAMSAFAVGDEWVSLTEAQKELAMNLYNVESTYHQMKQI